MKAREQSWNEFFDELQAYVEVHHHLPAKNVEEYSALLSKAKYLRKRINAGKAKTWQIERFHSILALRTNEHTGGRRRKQPVGEA